MRHLVKLALVLIIGSACAQRARVKRPNLSGGNQADLGDGYKSPAVRREQQEFTRKMKQKIRDNIDLFRRTPLNPMKTKYPPTKAECGQTALSDRVVSTAVIMTDESMARCRFPPPQVMGARPETCRGV